MEGTPISKTRHQSSFETIPKHHASVNNVFDLIGKKNMSRESTESDLQSDTHNSRTHLNRRGSVEN